MSVEKKIFNEKLNFREKACPRINSLENIEHQSKSSDKQIYSEQLPWLRHNRPNLPDHIKDQIHRKQYALDKDNVYYTPNFLEHDEDTRPKNRKSYFQKLNDEKKSLDLSSHKEETNDLIKKKDIGETKNEPKQSTAKLNPGTKLSDEKNSNKIVKKPENNQTTSTIINNDKGVKKESVRIQPQKRDASTETENVAFTSVEVQTKTEPINVQTKRLKNALRNSNTFENNYSLRSNHINSYSIQRPQRQANKQKEDIITSQVIETFLPSISYSEKENKTLGNGSYSSFNNRKGVTSKSLKTSSTKHAVTHAGINFLDQYWASQRWHMLKKDSETHSRDRHDFNGSREYTESDTETLPFVLNMKSPKPMDQKEKPNFRGLFTERIQYYTDSGDNLTDQYSLNIDKITSKDLEKITL